LRRAGCLSHLGWVAIAVASLTPTGNALAQRRIPCPDGDHYEIDLKQIAIQYDASSFAGTLSSLSVLGARLAVEPKRLQEAAAATQQWNEFVKGIAAGYNSCAVTKAQYAEGISQIYPRLKEDAVQLEEFRRLVSEGRRADLSRLQKTLDRYFADLRRFAAISGKEIIIERIEALAEETSRQAEELKSGQERILEQQRTGFEGILQRLAALERYRAEALPATPAEVQQEISEVRKSLLARADEAETAYNKGYELLNRSRFREASLFSSRRSQRFD
jgi:hypothetical protein